MTGSSFWALRELPRPVHFANGDLAGGTTSAFLRHFDSVNFVLGIFSFLSGSVLVAAVWLQRRAAACLGAVLLDVSKI